MMQPTHTCVGLWQPDDNSCLFHGVMHLLDPNTNADQMRNVVATAVTMNPMQWNAGTLGKVVSMEPVG